MIRNGILPVQADYSILHLELKYLIRLIAIILLGTVLLAGMRGQEVFYYGVNSRSVTDEADAQVKKEVKTRSDSRYTIRTFNKVNDNWRPVSREKIRSLGNDEILIRYYANSYFPKKKFYREIRQTSPGMFQFEESTVHLPVRTGYSSRYLPLHLEGEVTEYHRNGELKSKSLYRDNQLISNENWLPDGAKYIDSIFYSADVEPEYQMGDGFFKSYLLQSLTESKIDLTQIEDQVVIGWVVMETGELDGVIALQGKAPQLNEFLVKTIAGLPGYWIPAKLEGKTVRYFMSIPLNFVQRDVKFQEIEFSGGYMHYNRY
jgi:hypothetical protein